MSYVINFLLIIHLLLPIYIFSNTLMYINSNRPGEFKMILILLFIALLIKSILFQYYGESIIIIISTVLYPIIIKIIKTFKLNNNSEKNIFLCHIISWIGSILIKINAI